ncbi:MAG: hypothetical protein JW940_02925 [Polyangiaceae bacterium]|nr:hypothetical protein [Polyangiaceae bacterium]
MKSASVQLLIWTSSFAATGCCSYGLLQTAHTAPPASVQVRCGASEVINELTDDSERHPVLGLSGELGARVGLTRFLDIGAAPFFRLGVAADAKVNLMPSDEALALAPRLAVGYAEPAEESSLFMAEAGVIASYRWHWLEPYLGLAMSNNWIRYPREDTTLPPEQRWAAREGYGDGLLKSQLGVDMTIIGIFGLLAEYGYWKTLQNDPGDGFKFVDNHVFALAMRFGGGHE